MQKFKAGKAEPPFTPKLKTLVSVMACILASNQALANGTEPEVIAGDVSFSAQGNLLNITNSPGAIIHWQGFSIGAGDTTHFQQQSAISSVLNRVIGSDPSSILGTLSSNGQVFLINPSGILFGQDARVDVAGLVASTLNISNQDFRAGLLNFTADPLAGNVDSSGSITTPSGGSVYLVGANVSNGGLINSPQGDVILAAGSTVKIFDSSTPGVRVELTADANTAVNMGEILALSGEVGIYGAALRNSGSINADQVVRDENGRIVLRATRDVTLTTDSQLSASGEQGGTVSVQANTGTLLVDGSIDVRSTAAAGTGGHIALLGERVGLLDATIDASGTGGGGTVMVGGDYQGSNAQVQNAASTHVGPGATIKADALAQGDGGKVIVWADDFTRFAGHISARGDNGGTVETSGKQNLEVLGGSVDTSARLGLAGTWLLDPSNVNITTGATTGSFAGEIFAPNQDTAIVNAGTIATALATGNVNITTTNATGTQAGTITVSAPITRASGTGTTTLTLTPNQVTGGTITIASGAAISGTSGSPLNLTLAAAGVGSTVAVGAAVTTFGGSFSSTGTTFTNLAGAIDTSGSGASNGGSITLNHSTTMTIAAPLISGGGNISIAGGSTFTDTSTINSGTGTVTLRGSADTLAIGIGSTTGTYNITQAQIANITTTGGLFFGHSTGTGAIHIGTNEAVDFGSKNVTVLQASGGMTVEGSTVNGTGALTFNAGTGFFLNNSQILSTGAISLVADQVTLNANISGSTLSIAPFTASMAIKVGEAATRIDFGGTNFNTSSLTSNSLRPLKIGNTANTGGLTVTGAFNTGSPALELLSGGLLTINAGGTVSADRIVLAGSNFINNGGAAALVVPSSSYWLVYSTDPALNTFGGMASGSLALWGKTYAANPPATITDLTKHYIFSKVPRLTVSVSGGNLTKTYGTNLTGSAPSVVVAGLVNATTFGNVFLQDAYTGTAAAASAGFAATAAVNGGTPYVISAADNITAPAGYGTSIFDNTQLTVTPYVVSLSGTRVYDGSVNILAGALGTGTLIGTETLSLSGTGTVVSKNIGTGKTLTLGSLALADGSNGGLAANYTVTGGTHTAGITAAALTLSTSAVSKTYNGDLTALGTAVVNSGTLFTGDTLSGGTFAFTDKNVGAGNKTVTAADVTVSDGNSGSNYTVSYASNTASTISPFVVSLSGTRVYDGSVNILAGVLGTNALIGTETLTLSGTGTVASKNVGAGKTLTLGSLALGNGSNGGLAANYTVTGGTHTAGITAAALTLSTSAVSKTYNGDLTALGTAVVNSGTLFTGDTLSGGTFAFTDKNVGAGNKTVTAADVTVSDGNSGSNYTVSYASNTASTINPFVVSLSGTRTYDSSLNILAGVLGTGTLAGTETLSLSGTGTVASKNVGASKPLTLGSLALLDGTNGGLATNYTVTGGTHTASVTAAALTLSTSAVSKTYNGDLPALGTAVVSSGTLFTGDTLSGGTFAFTDKNVGLGNKTVTTADVTVSDGNSGSNYTVSYASNTASTINPFVVNLSGTRVYDGSLNILAGALGTNALVGTETLSVSGTGTVVSKNIGAGKTLTLGSLALGNGNNGGLATNYTVTGGTHTASVTAAALTLSTSAVSKTYNGDLTALGTAVVNSGTLFTGDTLNGGTFAFTDKNVGAGNKTVTAADVTVSDGNSGSNYTVSYASNTASTINPFVVSLSGTRTYDSSLNILAGILSTNALVGTETLSVSGTGTVATKNVGAGKTLTLGSLALGNGDNGGLATNYTVTGGTHTASVTAAALTLSTSAVSKTYDGNLTAVGTAVVNSGTLFTGDTISGGTFAFTDKNVGAGNKTVTTADVTVSDGNSGSNYTVSYASNTASTINPYVVNLSGTRVYDGTVNILAGILGTNALIGTETLSVSGTGTVVSKNIGAGKTLTLGSLALADGSNGGLAANYTVTGGTHTAGIMAAALTLSTSAVSKTYNGDLTALGTAVVNSGTLFTGDTLSGGTFAFTDKNVGLANKTVTAAGVTVSDGNSGSNYTVSYASNTASTINPYVVNLSGSRVYDGTVNILAGILGTNALVGTETLSLTGTGTVVSKNVGTGKTLTLGSLALGNGDNGGLAANYTVTGGTHTAGITAAALTLSTSAVSKTYNGDLTALGTAVVNSGTLFTGDTLSGGTFAFTDKNVGAGSKTVTAADVTINDGNGGSNYTVSYASNTASTINPYVVNLSGTRVYDGTVNILAGILGTNALVGTETLNVSGTGTVASKNIGASKTLTLGSLALGNGDNGGLATNYTVTGGTHTASVTAAALTLSTSAVSKTYDGNLSALGTAVVNSGTLFTGDTISGGTFAFTDKNVGAGNKTVTTADVTVSDGNSGSNYTVSYASNTASTINPYVVNLSGTRVYDGTVNILAGILGTNALIGTETLSVSGTGTVATKNVGAGKTLTLGSLALGNGDNGGLATNYTVTGGTHTASVTAAALTLSTSAVSKIYDGNLTALGTAVVNSGTLFTGDTISGGTFAFTDKNVGTGNKTVTAAGVTVSDGNSGSNYTVSYASNSASTINPFVVSLSGTRVYDGSVNILASALGTSTLIGTETLSLSGTGTVASKNVGAGKTLTLGSLTLGNGANGGVASNYTVTGGTHTAGITAAALTLSTSAVSKTYDGNLSALGTAVVNSGTLFTGDTISGGTFAFTDKNVGLSNKTVTAAGVTVSDGNGGSNYTVSYASNTASTINPYVVNLSGTRVYDGSVNILSGVLGTNALVGTETLNVSGTGTVASKSVGASKPLTLGTLALADGSNGGLATNYTVTGGTHTASVTAAALTLSTSAVSKTYDGNLSALGSAVVNSGTLFTGDTISGGTFAFTDKNVGLGNKTVTATGVTVNDGNSGSNYAVSYASNSASTINPFVVSLSGTRVYDGSVNILASALGTSTLIGTETLSLSGTGTVASKNVGAGKTLTLGSLALGNGANGGVASNYTVTGGTHTAGITAAALTLSTSAVSKTYDGNLSALGTAVVNSGTLFTGDTISGGTFAFTDKNVGLGNKTVTAAGVTVSDGNGGSNYTVSYASNTASTINPYVVNLSGTRVYDGSVNILSGVLGTNALVGTETLNVSGTGTVASKSVGASKPLTLGTLALADGANGGLATNYTVTGGTHTASVTAAALTLSTSAVSKTYDGNLTAVGTAVVNSGTLFTGDTLSGGTFAFTDKNVGLGNKTVTAAGVTVSDGNSGSNYTVSYASNSASTINPFVVSLSGTRVYDGSVNILAGILGTNALIGTETLSLTGTGTVATKNVGASKPLTLGTLALADGSNGGLATNYTVTGGTHTASVTAAALTLSTSAVSKTYDGNLSALGTAIVNSGTLFTGDTISGGTFAFTDKNVGAGSKTVTATDVTVNDGNSGSNYTVSYASNTASTINPYVVNLSGTRAYDGSTNILAGVLGTNALVGTETLSLTGTGTVATKNVGAGKTLTLGSLALADGTNGGLASNYTVTGGTHTASVTAAALTLSTSAVSKIYDGNLTAVGTAVVNSGTLFTGDTISGGTFAFTDKNVGAGNKTVTAAGVTVSDGNSGSNYTVSYASNTASTINPYVVNISGTRAYDGSANILAGMLGTNTLVGTETLNVSGTGTVASKNVGAGKTLTLGSLALGNGANGGLATNYTVTGGTHTAGITAAALTLSTNAVSKTYDGNLSALGSAVVNSGTLFTGDTLSGGTFAFTDKNVGLGNKTVTAAGVTVNDGNSGSNYTVSYASNTASTINPYVVNLSGTRVYDGTVNILAGILSTNALVGTETVSVSGTGTVTSKNLGASKPLTLGTLALGDGSNGGLATNYTVTGGTHTAGITAAALTLSTSAVSKTYDGNLSALGTAIVNSGTLFTGDSLSGGTFAFTDKNVGLGNKTVTATGVTVNDGNSGSNYTVSYASNTASTINPFVVSLTGSRAYDGSLNILAGALSTGTLVGTETLSLSGTGTVASKNVGASKPLTLGTLALADGSNGGLATNYTVTGGTHTAGITAAALTLSTSAVSKTYDSNLSALGTAVVNSGTLFTGDSLSGGTFAFTDKNVGAGNKTVTAAGVTISDGNSGGNYTVSYASNTASTINPFVVNLGGTRVYDGSTSILSGILGTNALVGTETLSVSGTGTVASKNVGASKPLTLGTLALADGSNGGLATNYTVTGGTHTASVTAAPLTLSTSAVSKTYDGNLSALGSAIVNSGTLFTGDTLSGGTFAFTDKNVGLGNKTVTAAGVTVSDGNSGSNYTVSYASNTASTINPFVVNLSGTRVYDGSVNILAGILGTNALVGTETLNVSGTGTVASKNVGAGKTLTLGSLALVDGSNGGLATNYTVTGGTHTASVTAAALTLSTSAVSKTYDGNLSALGTAIVNSGTLFTGDTLSGGTFAFTDKNVGAGNKTVTAAGVTVSDGNSGGNYTVSYASNTASTINPYVVNLSGTRVYDSSVTILASELRTNTLVGTETLSLSGTGTVANKNVGASKPLTLGTLALGNGTNGGLASNYTLTSGTHSVGITQALLNIAANAGVKVYDGLAWSGGNGVTYTGFKGSDTAADLTGTLVYGGNSQGATNVGNYNLVPSGQSSANYATTYVNGNLGITRAPLGIAANSSSKIYGSTLAFTGSEFSSTGLKNTETIGSVNLTSLGASATATVAGSPYDILASAATGGTFNPANYTISYVDGSLGITAAELGIAATAAIKVYDGLAWSGGNGVTYTGFQGTDTAATLTGTLVYGGNAQGATNAGTYSIAPSGQTSTNYTITYVNGSLGITRAPLGIAADSSSKTYGSTPVFVGDEFTSTGLKNAETIGSVSLTSTGTAANAGVAGSPYAIVASAATGGTFNPANYTIDYVDGSLGITAAELGITANAAAKVYDGLAWSGGNGVSYNGFQGTDTATSLTGTLVYGGTSQGAINAGNYSIAPSGQTSANYTITYVNGSLGITPATLGIAANSSSKTYGTELLFNGTEFSSTGLQNAETIGSVNLTSLGASSTATVEDSPYAIVASAASGGSFNPANYTITYVDGSLGVIRAGLLGIAANSAVKVYDGLAWSGGNGVTYTGFLGGDTAADLTGTLSYGGTSQGAINAGSYTIIPSGQSSTNYTITYVNGSLSVTRAPLGIVANSSSKIYGSTPVLAGTAFTSTGLKNLETIGSVTLTSAGVAATAGVAGGPYAIVPSAATGGSFTAANYTITYVNGSLGVTPAALGIAARAAVKVYDGLAWSGGNGVIYTGLRGGDTAASLTGTLTYGGSAQGAANAGNYIIAPSGLSSSNYTISYVNGSLGVTRAPLGIVANSSSKTYGTTRLFTGSEFSSTGLKNAQTIGSVSLSSVGALASAGVAGGPYAIVASTASGGTFNPANYTISYVNGSLGVTPAALGIAANAAVKGYNGLAWSGGNGVTYTGLRGTDTAASLSGTLTYGGNSQGAINAGNYSLRPSGLSSPNYTITYVNGSLGITRAPLGIVANSLSKNYGSTLAFVGTEFSSTGLKNAESIGAVTLTSAGTAATADVVGSPYAIVASAASGGTFNAANYSISYVDGNLGVIPVGLLGVVANSAAKVYDGLAWSGGNGVTYSGFQGTDTAADLIGTLVYGGTSQGAINVGNYTIVPSGQSATNYTLSYINGNLGITAAALGIVANSTSKSFGVEQTFTGTEFTSTGLKNAETIGTVTLTSAGAAAIADVAGSPYAIVPSAAAGGSFNPTNYTISYTNGTLAVVPAGLLGIVANPASKVYDGQAWSGGNGVSYSGFQGADTAANLSGTLTYGGTSQGAVDVGNYTIMPSGQSSTNYTISYVSGNLGISAAPLEIIADSTSKSFGTLHTFTGNEFISTGLRGVETIGSVTLTSPGSTATATVAGSPYAIVASAATGGSFIPTNYAISYTNGTLTVTPAGLLGIVANPASKVYDGLAWKGGNGVSYSGFQGSDTAATLSGTLTYGGSSQGAIDVGNYTIIPAGQSSPNYTITYVNSILGITPAPLAILANSSSKVYGSALGFTGTEFTSTGLQGAETIGAVSLSSAGAAAAASVAGGPYTIVPGAAGGGSFKPTNYTISYVDGSLNVTPAPLMVLADSQSKTFGTPDPQLSFRVTGLLNNPALGITDTAESVLTGALARRAGETVSGGPYAINSGTLTANSNYTMGFTPATLGITGITVVVAEELAEVNAVPVIFAGVIHNVFYYRPGNFWHISLNSNDADQGFDVMRGTGTAETRLRRSLNRCDSVSGSGFCETWTFPQQQDNDE